MSEINLENIKAITPLEETPVNKTPEKEDPTVLKERVKTRLKEIVDQNKVGNPNPELVEGTKEHIKPEGDTLGKKTEVAKKDSWIKKRINSFFGTKEAPGSTAKGIEKSVKKNPVEMFKQ